MATWRIFPCGCKVWANASGEVLRRYDKENYWCGKDKKDCYFQYLIVKSTALESVDGNQKYVRDWVLRLSKEDIVENIKEIMQHD